MALFNKEQELDAQYKKIVAEYLKNRCKEDLVLAEACNKENKSLDGVIAYIKSEAQKQAQDGVAVIPDEEVFNWAVHYILEDSLDKEPKEKECTIQNVEFVKTTLKKSEPKPATKTIKEEIQLELF